MVNSGLQTQPQLMLYMTVLLQRMVATGFHAVMQQMISSYLLSTITSQNVFGDFCGQVKPMHFECSYPCKVQDNCHLHACLRIPPQEAPHTEAIFSQNHGTFWVSWAVMLATATHLMVKIWSAMFLMHTKP